MYVCLIQVSVDKWMDITEMRYVIASRYNVILVLLSRQQSMTFFPLRSQLPKYCYVHRVICIGHVYDNHFVQVKAWSSCLFNLCIKLCYNNLNVYVYMKHVFWRDRCPLPSIALLWSTHCYVGFSGTWLIRV